MVFPKGISHDMNWSRPFSENFKLCNTLIYHHVQTIDNKPSLGRLLGYVLHESCNQGLIGQLLSVSVNVQGKGKMDILPR